jgi:dipeptidyl aminopeptidase/acylaminoacyl peptidase
MSERDGWNHLYLFDGVNGRVKNQITKGSWLVRGVDRIDPATRQVWFRASGMYAGKDPYFIHSYRINLDGSGLTTFTEADANHAVRFSGDGQFYLDRYSRVDLPPVMELRRTSDQKLVMTVEKADASALLATGWRPPEAFVAKGRDGTTDIYGVIVRPTNFNASKKYPVIEYIYAGPHDSFVPKTWGVQFGMQAQAELGFIVSQIEGWGRRIDRRRFTMWRGRTSATRDSPIAFGGIARSRRSIPRMTRRRWGSTAVPQAGRTRWARCCSIRSFTRSP